ncbi:hypothetical protein RZO85_13610 [Raoultella ornithinolytica]|uniref:O-antigen ligase family protein n=1 Tax=Raoultella TaxID=160674 RepID=UPI000E569E20|nr:MULTISPECIES: hypothetical protein [Raoultella]MDV0600742.1 hypothetical protein [Raoultella ornithinolytica]MDV1101748.1 hypothetical protein [Raoultella ornithinolytica]HDT6086165.1 hypothetical protein [Raoultella ornithinolytica]
MEYYKLSNIAAGVFLFLLVLMPAGSFLGINFKILTLLLFLGALVFDGRSEVIVSAIKKIFLPAVLLLIFIVYAVIANDQGILYLYQAKDIIIFFVVYAILSSYFYDNEKRDKAFKIIISALVFSAFIKIAMLAYSQVTGHPIVLLVKSYGQLFGMSLMTYAIDGSSLGRIQFLSDFIIPLALFYMLKDFGAGRFRKRDYIYFVAICFSVFIGMSRFYWAISALFIFLGVLFNVKGKGILSISILVVLVVGAASLNESVQNSLEARFSAQKSTASDNIRTQQLELFSKRIEQSPILGKGLGYFVPEYQQEGDMKYNYELQVPALAMQIGYLGVFALLLVLLIPFAMMLKKSTFRALIVASIAFWSWFLSGFFNPVLFSSAGGVCYVACLFLMALMCKENERVILH